MSAENGPPTSRVDPLDRATDVLKTAPQPSGPPERVIEATLAALRAASEPDDHLTFHKSERRSLMIRIARWSGAAAAVITVAAVTAVLVGTGSSFADVVERVQKARNVQFTMLQRLTEHGPEMRFRTTADDGHFRMEIPDTLVVIADFKSRKGVQIEIPNKIARPLAFDEAAARALFNPLDELQNLTRDAERIGQGEVDGRKADVYRVKSFRFFGHRGDGATDDERLTVWADPDTKLPVKIELTWPIATGQGRSVILMEDFAWDVDTKPEFFRIETPAGYQEAPPLSGNAT